MIVGFHITISVETFRATRARARPPRCQGVVLKRQVLAELGAIFDEQLKWEVANAE